jgi:glycosyltransferase involved in cell wall biosynthesis
MRWLLTVAAHRASGAAAAAVAFGRALHGSGHEVRLLHQRGRGAPSGFESIESAEPSLVRERRPADLRANLRTLGEGARWADVVITHLPHDHLLAVLAGAHRRATLIRAYRHPRHLRSDPLHRWLARRTAAALLAHSAMLPGYRHLSTAPALALPVPVADRFAPVPEAAPMPARRPVIGVVGKLAAGRGFEEALEAVARTHSEVSVLVIGHGERQWSLEERAWQLGLGGRVHWASKRESDLPQVLSSVDAFVFAAPGSDRGHRAISEAQACGRPVIAVDEPGVTDLVEHGVSGLVSAADPEALASSIDTVLGDPALARRLSDGAHHAATARRDSAIATTLTEFVEQLPPPTGWAEG